MTPQEVLNEYKDYLIIVGRRNGKSIDLEKAQIIVAALEKQIPKRPDIEGDGYDENGCLIYDTGYCPRCNEIYEIDYDAPKYCRNCGQALDWSDTE